jgi:hypothetical protein
MGVEMQVVGRGRFLPVEKCFDRIEEQNYETDVESCQKNFGTTYDLSFG